MGLLEDMSASGRGKTEPNADMREAAQGMWQIYTALKDAGFSRTDALELVRAMLVTTLSGSDEQTKEGQ
jgi:hypothetical protein